jgi:SAM-dependent methyltransferase
MSDSADVHHAARQGFSVEAQAYVRGRPDYPDEILGWLTGELGIAPGHCVVDLGAGTGKFTARLERTGARVIAVEPVAAMRAQLHDKLPQVQAIDGTAQAIPLPSESVDAVVCAQAFHWFAGDEALAEIQRVLKPGACLGLVWNVRDESVDWVATTSEIIAPYEGDVPRSRTGAWRAAFSAGRFSEPELTTLVHQHVGSADEVIVDRFLSVSFIAALPAAEKQKVADRLRELVATHPALRGRDTIAFPYRTEAYRCIRR